MTNPWQFIDSEENISIEQKDSMKASVMDGSFWSVMNGIGVPFIAPFALALGASASEVGLLAALPAGVAAIASLLSGKLVDSTGQRKRILVNVVFIHALSWLVILSIPFWVPKAFQVAALILAFCLYMFLGTFPSAAWSSMMADIVPKSLRGSFFSKRNQITSAVGLIATAVAGFFLSLFSPNQSLFGFAFVFWGFAALFLIAFYARILSWWYLGKMKEYPYQAEEVIISPKKILDGMGKNEYLDSVTFIGLATFGMALATPFLAVYVVRDLGFGLAEFGLITAVTGIATVLGAPYWGQISDMFGRKRMLWVTTALLPVAPITWIFFHELWQLVLIQFFFGFVLAGFNLNAFNYVMDTVPNKGRTTYLSFYNATNQSALCLGGLLGAGLIILFEVYQFPVFSPVRLLFLVSALVSLFPIFWLTRFEERKDPVENIQLIWNTAFMLPSATFFLEWEKRQRSLDELGGYTLTELARVPLIGAELSLKTQQLVEQTESALEKEIGFWGNLTLEELERVSKESIRLSASTLKLADRTRKAVLSELKGKELKKPKNTLITKKEEL